MNTKKPSAELLAKWSELTANNAHTEWYVEVTKWCKENCVDKLEKAVFTYLEGEFNRIKAIHYEKGFLSKDVYDFRNMLGDLLNSAIEAEFGKGTFDMISEAA